MVFRLWDLKILQIHKENKGFASAGRPNINKYARNMKFLRSPDLKLFKICKENKGFAPPKAPKMSSDPLPKFFNILAC